MTADPRKEKKSSGQNARRPGRDHLVTGGGIIQESLGAIIPLQTGGFVGIGISSLFPEPAPSIARLHGAGGGAALLTLMHAFYRGQPPRVTKTVSATDL